MPVIPSRALAGLLFGCLAIGACKSSQPSEQPAYSAEQSAAAMQLSEDFHVDVFLKEPQVMSPVEMVFDEDGRIYVAEMLDYPDDPPAGRPARSRIRLLEDRDGDGKYETESVFADQVLEVSGILPWKGGLFVTSAPDILWMKDENGDGKTDVRKVLYTGFPKVNPEARITNLRYGIDNWIYAANNGNDGRITAPDQPNHAPVLIRGADFRFNPVSGEFEAASGPAQFGSSFDEWGNQYITQNTIHIRHVVLPMRYAARSPLLEIPAYANDISDHGKPSAPMFPLTGPQAWRRQRTDLRQKRYDEQGLNRREFVGGYFTGASGGTVYTGDAWPDEYRNNVFTGDVSANLVHRDIISPDGVTFKASRSKDGTEFLASRDQWFRPCNFANAPDGNLYLLDVYRLFIETPESIPEEIKKGMDFYAGDTMGRIYRISSNKPQKQRDLKPNLSHASVEGLVKNLENTNGWHRTTAQRLLVSRQDKSAVPYLRTMALNSASSLGRLHALWTLAGLNALDERLVLGALKDRESYLRQHAVQLAEGLLSKSTALRSAVVAMRSDPERRVRFQIAFTLGEIRDRRAFDSLVQLAIAESGDSWFRLAILSSIGNASAKFFDAIRTANPVFENGDLFQQLGALTGAQHDSAEIAGFVKHLTGLKKPELALSGLARGLNLAGVRSLPGAGIEVVLGPFLGSEDNGVSKAAWDVARYFELKTLVEAALKHLAGTNLTVKERVSAIRALRGGQYAIVSPALISTLASSESAEIKVAAIDALSSFDDPGVGAGLMNSWASYTPEVRLKALEAMLAEKERMKLLLKAVEDGKVEKTAIGEEIRVRLYDHPENEVAEKARALFKGEAEDRGQAVARYRDVLKMRGDQTAGKAVFEQACARCHLPQKGGRIGPDLSGVNNKTKEELLTSILNPSFAIEPRFVNYNVTTRDGRIHNGVLANETPGAVTLRGLDGDVTILRNNITEIRASGMSLMPGAFEVLINKQQMADLIAYLRAGL